MTKPLAGLKTAVLVANGFEELDMTYSQRALLQAGAKISLISTEQGLVNSWTGAGWGHHFAVESHVGQTLAADFQGLVIPGGERSVARLMTNPHTRRIIVGFMDTRKPVAVFGEAVKLLAWAERPGGENVLNLESGNPEVIASVIEHLSGGPIAAQQAA